MHDIVIAGAGPVGLFLACELRLAGVSVLVLEQADDPRSPLKRLPFGLRGLTAPTLEALHRRGLLDEVAALHLSKDGTANARIAAAAHWIGQPRRPAGHFAGIVFHHDRIDASKWPYRLPGRAGTSLAVEMEALERVLAARAQALGVEIRRGAGVDRIEVAHDGVGVHAGGARVEARWLVGCDGGRSTVRKASGIDFAGTEPEFTGYSVDVDIADPDMLRPGRQYTPAGMYTYTRPNTIAMVEFDGGAFHRVQPITRDHVQSVLRRVSGTDVTLSALRVATTWTDRAYQASAYRAGRVLLAGDAAHVHSPLGGQGLNLGIGDAMNLGWKLAAAVRGDAPADLLDSYERERRPVGAQVLDWSRAQVALMRPCPGSRALEAILRDLVDTRDGATYFAERVWGLALRYDLGDDHPLVGRSVPDFAFADGTSMGERLRTGNGVLVDFDARAPLRALAARCSGRVDYVACAARETLGFGAVLVRPDGIVAWAAEGAPDPDLAALATARWFGGA
ncbi:MAG: FAD-dependent monooxygenase [Dokdonella sp.]|uniref:FAD-dependent monooxygenase n=1 Tax=Dokdonella sp. TaxID=2291710 RepID=UPI003F7F940B